jgi:protein MpaA
MLRRASCVLCLVLCGCGTAAVPAGVRARPASAPAAAVEGAGLRARVPAGWHARRVPTPGSPRGEVMLQLATMPLDHGGPPEALAPDDVVVTLIPRPAGEAGRPPDPARFDDQAFVRVADDHKPGGQDLARTTMALGGLDILAEAAFGTRPARPDRIRAADAVLTGLEAVGSAAAAAPVRPALARLTRLMGPRLIAGVPAGRSARGRPLRVTASGDPAAPRRVLVVGCIHGTECAGMAVARRVQRGATGCPPGTADVWAIADLDPDGRVAGSRLNGRGVDLNRNFPAGWRAGGRPGDLEYPGPRPFSEPETRAVRDVIRALRPTLTIWFHQQAETLVRAWGRSVPAARRYARLAGLPFRRMPWLAGTAPHWQNTAFASGASFVVELAPGALTGRAAWRHASAVLRTAGIPLASRPGQG